MSERAGERDSSAASSREGSASDRGDPSATVSVVAAPDAIGILQRAAGNHAVARLLAGDFPRPGGGVIFGLARGTLQRCSCGGVIPPSQLQCVQCQRADADEDMQGEPSAVERVSGASGRLLARTVQGDPMLQSIDDSWARALDDAELAQQLAILRSAAVSHGDEATRTTAQENLLVLEHEQVRRFPHGPPPAGPSRASSTPQPRSDGRFAMVGPPLAVTLGQVVPVLPVPPTGPPPYLPPPTVPPGPTPPTWQYRPPPIIRTPPPPVSPIVRPWWAVGGATVAAVAVGLVVFLWPRETAPPWMDTINPLTGGPYRNEEEYNRVRRMGQEEFAEAMSRARGRRWGSLAPRTGGEGGEGQPPSSDNCDKAIKLLEQYERLAEELGSQLGQAQLDRLNGLRNSGQIRSTDLPGRLQREWPGGVLDGKTLDEIRQLCGKPRRQPPPN